LASAAESEGWNPVPGSTGHKAPKSPSEDEDETGAAITKGSWKRASPKRNMTKCFKPAGLKQEADDRK